MAFTGIRAGTKVIIKITQQTARQQQTGSVHAKEYLSQIFDIRDDETLVLYIPMDKRKLIALSTKLRYDFMFSTDKGFLLSHGNITSLYKQGNFYLMDAVLTSPLERFQRREYFRLDCSIEASCLPLGDDKLDPLQIGDIDKYISENIPDYIRPEKGVILNISGGGALFVTAGDLKGNEFVLLRMELNEDDKRQDRLEIIGRILDCRQIPENGKFRYRIMFVFKNQRFRERIIQYVFDEQRRQRKKEQGI